MLTVVEGNSEGASENLQRGLTEKLLFLFSFFLLVVKVFIMGISTGEVRIMYSLKFTSYRSVL